MFEKLGKFINRRKKPVLVTFVIALLLSGFFGFQAFSRFDSGGYNDPNSDSAKVQQILEDDFDIKQPSLVLAVGSKTQNIDDPNVALTANELEKELKKEEAVENVISYWSAGNAPFLKSEDGNSGLMFVYFKTSDFTEADKLGGIFQEKYDGQFKDLDVYISGQAVFANAINGRIQDDLKIAESIAIPLTFILLLIIFGAMVAASMPLVIGITSIIGTFLVMYLLTFVTDISIFVLNLTTGLGLGLGIDYALLIVNRFREELAKGVKKDKAIVNTMKTAGKTVFYSGLTVVVTLISLTFFPLNFLKSMGYAGASVVTLAVLGALIPLPAILSLLGNNVNKGRIRKNAFANSDKGRWSKFARFVMRRPVTIVAISAAILTVFISQITNVKFSQIDTDVLPKSDRAYISSDFIAQEFPGEEGTPIEFIFPNGASNLGSVTQYLNLVKDTDGITRVGETQISGQLVRAEAIHSVKPRTPEGEKLIQDLRNLSGETEILIGGQAADYADTQGAIRDNLGLVIGWIMVTIFILLFAFTGSILLPIKAVLLNFISLAATVGAISWVFIDGNLKWLFGDFNVNGTIDTNTLVLVTIVAFGLSMDYEVFLLSRIKEEHDLGKSNIDAVALGLQKSARIITAAALILAIVFAAFLTSGVTTIKLLGFGVAFAILLDATVIRALLVPALMRLFGERNWWAPKPLKRFQIKH
ncbi:MAG: MMPL family transporter [Actinomycetes bacterium]